MLDKGDKFAEQEQAMIDAFAAANHYKTDADGFTTSSGPPIARGYKHIGGKEEGNKN